MSLKSWKDEFYRSHADSPAAQGRPAAHALRKWLGLRASTLRRHRLRVTADMDISGWLRTMEIGTATCALCVRYILADCVDCPLAKARGNVRCDKNRKGEEVSPWDAWSHAGNPEPMIAWLEKAAQLEARGGSGDA